MWVTGAAEAPEEEGNEAPEVDGTGGGRGGGGRSSGEESTLITSGCKVMNTVITGYSV